MYTPDVHSRSASGTGGTKKQDGQDKILTMKGTKEEEEK